MQIAVTEHVARNDRHTTFFLSAGPRNGSPIIFVHGWPELSISWRHQLPVFGSLGFHAVAPDMRGYGRSSCYKNHSAYAQREIVRDMIELADALQIDKAIWVGHDWGGPVVWNIASHHPDRCAGVASLCVPYYTLERGLDALLALVDRKLYPETEFPAGQWEYMRFYEENFDKACSAFDAKPENTVRALFRAGNPAGRGKPSATARVRQTNGWFGGEPSAPDVPRDASVLSEADMHGYASALRRNGFFGPDSWYMNHEANAAYAQEAANGGYLDMPALLLEAEHDYTCDCVGSRLAEPGRHYCRDLTVKRVPSGHWMAQEKPADVNAHIVSWIVQKLPDRWPSQ